MRDLPPTRLHIESREITQVKRALLWLSIATEEWVLTSTTWFGLQKNHDWLYGADHLGVRWDCIIVIDETSDEDGGACPEFDAEFDGKTFPARLEAISGMRLVQGEGGAFHAHYGKELLDLEKNIVVLGDWIDDTHIMMRWSAEYYRDERRRQKIPFLFEGPVVFDGISMSVKKEEDAAPFLSRVLPALDTSQLEMVWGPEFLHDEEGYAPDRRRWREVSWRRKPA